MKKTVSGNVKNEMTVPQYRIILHRGSGFTSLNLVKKLPLWASPLLVLLSLFPLWSALNLEGVGKLPFGVGGASVG
jgi:antibiotic biosynthesis monooxygenase (ABM) superfamily enzyme